jgi:hypothetical protein
MAHKSQIRDNVIDGVEKLLIGPRQGDEEFIEGRLTLAYLAGILFPKGEKRSDLAKESASDLEDETEGVVSNPVVSDDFSGDRENPLSMANEELPSSVGISFVIRKDSVFKVEVNAARYLKGTNEAGRDGYHRKPIPSEIIDSGQLDSSTIPVLDGAGELSMLERPSSFRADCRIITISLVNPATAKGSQHKKENLSNRLYQVALTCCCEEAGIEPYDAYFENAADSEDAILQLQYKHNPTYAVGHGCSVAWNDKEGKVTEVKIAYMPRQPVFRPIFDTVKIGDDQSFEHLGVFDIRRLALAKDGDQKDICHELNQFIDFYETWIVHQKSLDCEKYEDVASTLLSRMKGCSQRMREGVRLLQDDPSCWEAFTMANLAMLFQIEQTLRVRNVRSEREREGKAWPIPWDEPVDVFNLDISQLPAGFTPAWRPFQLGFFLTVVAGLEDPENSDHSIVDLIWFSTGGGKTEAYLLLSSYELIRRRMKFKERGGGTGIITRYTLRFLTADQFARTACLGCALEKVRYLSDGFLGDEPFRVGIYAGNAVSYASYSDAQTALRALEESPAEPHHFHISECPNCGTSLLPAKVTFDENDNPQGFGIKTVAGSKIEYVCQNSKCLFSGDLKIPVTAIDEEIYEDPPSFLLGVIDKFAMVPLTELAGNIFGRRKGSYVVPPTLIIQDEVHLISGPLGTVAAIYEAGFDTLIRTYQKRLGLPATGPKYIASSATVRDSERQIERLTGRPSAIFPPRGIMAGDSFFAREERQQDTARLYVGLMAQGLRGTSAAHWTSAAILQSVRHAAGQLGSKEDCDFLWTLLCYCNSKRELGLINGAVNQEILERMRVYADAQKLDPEDLNPLLKEEVSSDSVISISATRGNLLKGVSDSGRSYAKDFVPCTNMISVGIDIDRLGAMMVNGQPKTTAEYIQATSRVGRSPEKQGPGLVITLYSPAKPRDRSHYEHFKSYHQALYRLVEPTSVTPGSEQGLAKCCHAAIVTAIRHGVKGMQANDRASHLNLEGSSTKEVLGIFRDRLLAAYRDTDQFEIDRINESIDAFLGKWQDWKKFKLNYRSRDKDSFRLLFGHNDARANEVGVQTMFSMRGVDVEIEVKK